MKSLPLSASRRALLAAFAGLAVAAPLAAQRTVTYTAGATDATAYSITAPNDPTTLYLDSGSATQSGVISGSGQLNKTGAGTVTLTGTNTYTGTTRIEAGTLAATGSAQLNGTALQLAGGTLQFTANAQTLSSGITVTGASTLAFARGSNLLSSTITGDSNASLTLSQGNAEGAALTLQSNLSGYSGTLILAKPSAGYTYRLNSSTPLASGANTLWQVNAGAVLFYNGTASSTVVQLGGLQGGGTLRGGVAASGAGTLTYQIGARGTSTTFDGVIENNVSVTALTKVGPGSLTLAGTNTYTGATAIDAGSLLVNGSLANSAVAVGAAGTLGGTGFIGGATTVHGALRTNAAPVDATSRLTFTGTLTLASDSTTTFDIDGASYTGVTVTTAGALTFGGALNVNFISGATPGTYDLFAFTGSAPGSFTTVAIANAGGLALDAGLWAGTYGGNHYVFDGLTGDLTVSAIPEPSAWAAVAGLLGLGFALRRRRGAAARSSS